MDLPAWLEGADPVDADAAARAQASAANGPAVLEVANGRGVAAALAASLTEEALLVDARGARSEADLRLALGHALGAVPPGEATALKRTLAAQHPGLIVMVGGTPEAARQAVGQLSALTPLPRWLALPDAREDTREDDITAEVPAPPLSPAIRALSALPRGLPRISGVVRPDLQPSDPGRLALPAAAKGTPGSTGDTDAAAVVAQLHSSLLDLSVCAPLPRDVVLADLFALDWLAQTHADALVAAQAAAAAGRLRGAWGQPGAACRELREHARNAATMPEIAGALIDQAEGDVLFAAGNRDRAFTAWERASWRLRRTRALPLLLTLLRHRASALLARGDTHDAGAVLREARTLARELHDAGARSACLRASADTATAAGEILGAEALYDQAAENPAPAREVANRLAGAAGLALGQGDVERARALLTRTVGELPPLASANRARRLADLALADDDPGGVASHARVAADGYSATGETIARARAMRLLGDAHLAQGALACAALAYREAIAGHLRTQDLAGLRRTLSRAALVEAQAGQVELAARLEATAAALQS
jgi:tetratricopeptide (TPR) repeat protein